MRRHPVVVAAVAVLLFGIAAVGAILYATRPGFLASWSSVGAGSTAPGSAPAASTPPPVLYPVAPRVASEPPNLAAPRPAPPGYRPTDPPIIEVAPAPVLPKKREAREQAVIDARKDRFASAMDALNRRTAARAGLANPPAPPTPPAPAAYNSRRGSLSSAEPAPRAQQAQ